MSNKSPMTELGAQRLREELHQLKSVERPHIINAIAEARAMGDLRENAEYHAAREQQSFVEGRIGDIENKLANAEIIDVTKVNANGRVVFGATVELLNANTDDEVSYRIVGEDEADIRAGLV
ncbi:MAG: transcription elongation factor GreA, partial [Gammaproteobacteria bacterium]